MLHCLWDKTLMFVMTLFWGSFNIRVKAVSAKLKPEPLTEITEYIGFNQLSINYQPWVVHAKCSECMNLGESALTRHRLIISYLRSSFPVGRIAMRVNGRRKREHGETQDKKKKKKQKQENGVRARSYNLLFQGTSPCRNAREDNSEIGSLGKNLTYFPKSRINNCRITNI